MQQDKKHLETERKMTLRVGKSIRSTSMNMYESILIQKNIKKTQESMRPHQQKSRDMKRLRAENLQNIPVVATPVEAEDSPSSYSYWSLLPRPVKNAISSLPGSPRRNKEVVKELALKVKLNFTKSKLCQSSQKALSEEIKQTVRTFYLCDDVSHWCPGNHDTVFVKEKKLKKAMQQRYLQLSMNELYAQFVKEHPKITIGKTKFQLLHVLYSS